MNFSHKSIYFPLLFLLGIFVGIFFHASGIGGVFFSKETPSGSEKNLSSDVFTSEKIKETQKIIQKEYYHFSEKTKDDIENGVISSLVGSLGDKHSTYFNTKEAKEFSEVLRGDFEGIGAVIDEDIKWVIIRKVFPLSPAEKAGLQAGDIITHIFWEHISGISAEEAVKKIRGPKGSPVMIRYVWGNSGEEKDIQIIRDTVMIPSAQEKMLTGSIGYIEVAFFGEHTTEEFQKSFQNLTASGAKGIILDFRNNGGGYLDTAVNVLSLLLPENSATVITRENDPTKTQTLMTVKNPYTNTTIPLVMIVNELSASATEIVAGALQDHSRAIVIGETSYGKGSVQEPFVLSDGSILKVTIGRWYTPKDRGIDGVGIPPDIRIPLLPKDFEKQYDRQFEGAISVMKTLLENKNSIEATKTALKGKDFTQ